MVLSARMINHKMLTTIVEGMAECGYHIGRRYNHAEINNRLWTCKSLSFSAAHRGQRQ